ncbi:chemotaxis protein CheA [Schlegelella sp. S2-27]|uniref:Chemotaxis protein CheA n=1 Tax=Caldimonas mangrovi TaxID=2944811 RepID=A0ABT0YX50_9BURK|nr:chemotaxis protein CheA [Caldimonas mangrovi]MCM5682952.1 chemotaxis protein CheA [Caldimonas mangrovi]
MNLDDALQTFLAEGRELLDDMERALLSLRNAQDEAEAVNAIFRAAHTIKGSSGLFGLDHIVAFTHVVESVLDDVRSGQTSIDDTLLSTLLACCDHLAALLEAVAAGRLDADPALTEQAQPLLEQLRQRLGERSAVVPVAPDHGFARVERDDGDADAWHISLRFGRSVLRNGMDPLSFIRYLGTIGRITAIVTLPDALPASEEMDPESCYLGFEIALRTKADKATIESVFDFVLDDCALRILPPDSRIEQYIDLIRSLPEEPARIGEILVRCGTITPHELEAALQAQTGSKAAQKIGSILIEQGSAPPVVVAAALEKQGKARDAKAKESRSVRVDADKLDHLIDLVGELIIASAGASLAARSTRNAELQEAHSTLAGLVEEVRDSALQLRMVKIGGTFTRFQRVVHDVSKELGKDIRLLVSGEDTELDKTVVEKIADPLTHLVRNSMDHGIEPAETRVQHGKPAQGTVQLNAYHDSGSIVIEVSDDGGGLNRERILAKALERGLVEPGRSLSDSEIYALIFEPGFSTAEQITNLSGRGVGMDVVKRNITALRGTVHIDSEAGVGTTVTVRLPLTLAIINGFQVAVGRSVFVVPLEMVEECIEYAAEPGHDYTNLRGEVLPFIRLRELFEIAAPAGARQNIVVVRVGSQKAGVVVDTLLGEFQTVIKPLARMFGQVKGISGSSIRGNGEVALILDVPALLAQAARAGAELHGEAELACS